MATWGEGPYENDVAVEYAQNLTVLDPDDVDSALHASMEDVLEGREDDLETWQTAVAAAAVVAGHEDETLGMESPIATWLSEEPLEITEDLRELAARILTGALQGGALTRRWEIRGALDDARAELEAYQDALK